MVWSRDEERRRARDGEESDDERDYRKKEERETEDRMGGCVQTRHADCGTESGRGRRRDVLEGRDQQPLPATPDDGKSQRRRRSTHINTLSFRCRASVR